MNWLTDLPLEDLLKYEPGGKLLQTLLLFLIYLNIRALKQALMELESGHDKRLTVLESKQERTDGRIIVLETHLGGK